MQSIVRQMLIAVGILVVITVAYQVISSWVAQVNPPPTPTPFPTNVLSTRGAPALTSAVQVHSQKLIGGNTAIIDQANVEQAGWVSIHNDQAGNPAAEVFGYTYLPKGPHTNVQVKLTNTKGLTSRLWAVLHVDAGKLGVFEYPGADTLVFTVRQNYIKAFFDVTH